LTAFGLPVLIAEAFGYLGGAFLLAAWFAWVANRSTQADDPGWVIGIGASVAALGMGILGVALNRADERGRRAAGVAFLVGLASVGTAAFTFASKAGLDGPDAAVVASATTLAFAIACRAFQPALLTQLGLLAALTTLASALLSWFEQTVAPNRATIADGVLLSSPDPIILVLGSAALWLSVAVVIGLLALVESGAGEGSDATEGRRASLSRFWAGMVAVLGLASAISRSEYRTTTDYGRVLAPWVGDLGLLILAAVLIERAFRREASAYVYAAALGLIIALCDLNVSYLTTGIESALLVEGLILLAAGIAADRLRRQIGRPGSPPPESGDVGIDPPDLPNQIEDLTPEAVITTPIRR